VAKRHDDLGPVRARADELHDLRAELLSRAGGESGDPLGVEEHHPSPRDEPATPVLRRELDHEEVPLVVESVARVLEVGQRFAAERLQEVQVLFAALEGLLHRDDAVAEHSRLRHGSPTSYVRNKTQPIVTPASRKISLAMINR
jgi:CO/xanthine dehydrogenase Mo-binding subunit